MNKEKIFKLLEYLHCAEFEPVEAEHRDILRKSIKRARFVMTSYSTMCVGAVSGNNNALLTLNYQGLV